MNKLLYAELLKGQYSRIRFIAFAILMLITVIFAFSDKAVLARNNFVVISLPKGLDLEFPQNWIVLSNNQRITLNSAVESRLDLSGLPIPDSTFPFAANLYNDAGETIGIANIRYYPNNQLSQAEAQQLNSQDVNVLDASIKTNILKSTKAFGISVLSWEGTIKDTVNGVTVFITEYHRKILTDSKPFRVRLVRVCASERSFTLTVSYRESASIILEPITDRIIKSIKLSGYDISQQSQKADLASRLWSSTSEGFGATFPETPKKVSVTNSQMTGYAYQSAKKFTNGGALYSITVLPIPSDIDKSSFNSLLEMSNDAFMKSMGQDPKKAKINWNSFGDCRKRLEYDFRFIYDEMPFRGHGFWIIDGNRAIRVSVSYTERLTSKEEDEVLHFPESFCILAKEQEHENGTAWFKKIKWGMTPEALVRKLPEITLYAKREKSALANVYMFAGSKHRIENNTVVIEYGGIGLESNLEIIMAFIQEPTKKGYFEYRKMLVEGYGIPARSTEIPGSLKHPVGSGMLESHWDLFDRDIIITLVYNGNGNPPRLNMVFSSIKAANKIMEYYNPN